MEYYKTIDFLINIYEYDSMVKRDEFKKMPIYPNNGSIKIINNIIVIKISDKVF